MAKEAKKPGSPKGTPGKAAGPAKAKEKSKTREMRGYIAPAPKSKTREMRGYIAPAKKKATPSKGSTSYSPKPMTAAAKKKAAAAGKATGAKTSARKPKAGSGVVSKVAGRAKTVRREVRDVPTALGTSVMGYLNPSGIVKPGPSTKNLAKQIKEAGRAVLTGKKGTASDRNTRSVRGEFGTVTGRYGYEKGKKRK
jgi:hypothetical protein